MIQQWFKSAAELGGDNLLWIHQRVLGTLFTLHIVIKQFFNKKKLLISAGLISFLMLCVHNS